MKIEELNLDMRTYNAVKRSGCETVEEIRQRMSDDPDGLRRDIGYATFSKVEELLAGLAESQETQEKPTVIVSEDYTRAVSLTRSIIANAQAAQQSLYEVCKGLKEMRDGKLYKELGYQKFEDYCENEVEIKWRQAYNFISIAEGFTPDSLQSIAKIGTTKLALLAKLDEPTRETITETVDVENTTVKELKAQIMALTAERDENEHAAALLSNELDSAKEALGAKQDELDELRAGNKRRYETLFNKIKELNAQLAEAKEAASQEVAVEDTSRIEELEQQLAECKRKLDERPMVQTALPGDGRERRRGEYAAISNAVEHAMEDLIDFLEDNDHCSDFCYFANRAKEKLREYNSEINDMLAKEETQCQ